VRQSNSCASPPGRGRSVRTLRCRGYRQAVASLDRPAANFSCARQSTFLASHLAIIWLMIEAAKWRTPCSTRIFISAARRWPRRVHSPVRSPRRSPGQPATGLAEALPQGRRKRQYIRRFVFPRKRKFRERSSDCWLPKTFTGARQTHGPPRPSRKRSALRGVSPAILLRRITTFPCADLSPRLRGVCQLKSGDGEFL